MKLSRLWAVARKEFIQIFRDPRSLLMAIAIPMLLLLLFGYALTLDVDRVLVAVWDQSRSQASRELLSRFAGSRYFMLRDHVDNYRTIEDLIDRRDVMMALVIPRDFASLTEAGRPSDVQLIIDGSDSNTASIALGYAEIVVADYSQEIIVRQAVRAGRRPVDPPLEVRPRVWFNEQLESKNYIVPGLIAVIMMVIAALLTSLTVAREWERGTMEQLISTPVRGSELILGKILPYFVIGMFDVAMAVLMGQFLFDVPLRGSPALLFATAAIFLAGSLGLGLLISIMARNQLLANQLAMILTFMPSFLLSGFMYAIPNMPPPIQVATHLIPARYFIAILKAIYLKGVGLEIIGLEVVLLTVFAVVILLVARLRFRKKLV